MTKQIGSQIDVPDVGDPIISPWYQDTAKKIVHPFASVADRDAKWPVATVPRGALCTTADTDTLWQKGATAWINVTGQWVSGGQFVTNVSGTAVAMFRKVGPVVDWHGMWTGAALGAPVATAPFPFMSRSIYWTGIAMYRSVGVEYQSGACINTDAGTGLQFTCNRGVGGIVTASTPFTWKAGDQGSWAIRYETTP